MNTENFWKYVQRGKPDECWLWTGARWSSGYARYGKRGSGHRRMYEEENGPIPPGLIVRHSCDRKLCVNPRHLLIGTYRDNSQDAKIRGRLNSPVGDRNGSRRHPERLARGKDHWTARTPEKIARGDRQGSRKRLLTNEAVHYTAKLKRSDIPMIKKLRASGLSRREVGEKFGISKLTVWRIVTERSWQHLKKE